MILKPIIKEDGTKDFTSISISEALEYENKDELVFTNKEEEKQIKMNKDTQEYEEKEKNDNKLKKLLPFLEDEQLDEIADGIINNDKKYTKFSLTSILPFLSEEKCAGLFIMYCNEKTEEGRQKARNIVPFVSSNVLSELVDGYIEGKYDYDLISDYYPFMESDTIKRLFEFELNK